MSKVKYLNKTIPYTVNKAKIKNIYISIQNGEVVIKAPWYTTSTQIQEIVESKREWITKKLQEYQTSPRKTKDYNPKKVIKPNKTCIEIQSFGLKSPQGPKLPFPQIQLNKFDSILDLIIFQIIGLGILQQ